MKITAKFLTDARLGNMKVEKQQFDAVLAKLLSTPPTSKAEIVTDPKRGRPRKTAPKRKPSR
jgi:hypothetical protein